MVPEEPGGLLPIVTLITVALFDSHLAADNTIHHIYDKSNTLQLVLKRSPNFSVDCSIDIKYYSEPGPLHFTCRSDPFTYYDQWYLDVVEPDNGHVHIATMEKSPSQFLIQFHDIFYVCTHSCKILSRESLPKGIATTNCSGCCTDEYALEELVWSEHLHKRNQNIAGSYSDYIIEGACIHVYYRRVLQQRSPLKRLSNFRIPN